MSKAISSLERGRGAILFISSFVRGKKIRYFQQIIKSWKKINLLYLMNVSNTCDLFFLKKQKEKVREKKQQYPIVLYVLHGP